MVIRKLGLFLTVSVAPYWLSFASPNNTPQMKTKPLYLNIIWHQHQPLYLDPGTDQLQGPWVRTHGTKDYYDMVAILERYPKIHFTVNLTSSLLYQLEEYYVNRLKPFVDVKKNRVDAKAYFAEREGKTDPWIDLALKPTSSFTKKDLQFLLHNVWNAFGVSEVMIERFPAYKALRELARQSKGEGLSEQQLREIKFWFYLAYFDPDFLESRQKLANGYVIDLTDLVVKGSNGTYALKKVIDEEDCNRLIAETYKVLANIIPIHKKLMYHPISYKGQIEVITTPFYHPILPLIYDSDLAKLCQPHDPMPPRFHFPEDADAQVAKAVAYYQRMFGQLPTGMWPAEGSVAHDLVPVFARHGIKWIATDEKILARSKPPNQPKYYPYSLSADHASKNVVSIVFRDTELSDKIGFVYQHFKGEDAAQDFVQNVLKYAPQEDEPDRLLTVILDGENAWEWYRYDNDAKEFQNALYRKLTELYEAKQVITVTMTEYIKGNPQRNVPAHPIESMPTLKWLWPGSWINANYDTWIGEDEENRAWEYLLIARQDLEQSGIKPPDPQDPSPKENTKKWYAYRAWESMYAAEGSDWFWWYGTDQSAPAGDKPFDIAYITHLNNVYRFARLAGGRMPQRKFEPIIRDAKVDQRVQQGTMAQSADDLVPVIFRCDARGKEVPKALYIVGNHPSLGNWKPNLVQLFDDGTHGDDQAGDGIWGLELKLPAGIEIQYKYTNSGPEGSWYPGEEFPYHNRSLRIERQDGKPLIVLDKFGTL
ncbi:MAG TPA: carbohydrate-binding module family 20 domain-containing protein [Bacteroidota bacterium]|nr:carbohydrate-binding module family 20 domain-containing protein [Bacteroidota bacterium]